MVQLGITCGVHEYVCEMPGFKIPKKVFKGSENYYQCLECTSCKLLLRDPVQPVCGHRLCKSCADEIITRESIPRCPECEEKFSVEDGGAHYFQDRFVQREINSLAVVCPFSETGCNWEGKIESYENHISRCRVQPRSKDSYSKSYTCTSCKLLLQNPVQSISCGHRFCCSCAEKIVTCQSKPRCPECEEKFTDEDGEYYFPDPFAERKIKNLVVICPFSEAGCDWEGNFEECHVHLGMCNYKSDLRQCLKPFPGSVDFEQGDLVHCHSHESIIQGHKRSEEPSSQPQLKDLLTKAKDHLLCNLKEAVENKLKESDVVSLRVQIAMLEKQIYSVNVRQKCSYFVDTNDDGSLDLTWRIIKLSQQIADAQNGKSTVLSWPIYSERLGYKMCLWLYIMGDGIGKGTHLSLFFVVMHGEFDNILQWPFTHKVTFKLINQAGGRDIVDTFQLDPSDSFGKPKSDMNIASGCSRFVSHKELERGGFIVDDTIFIKCTIDTFDFHHP